MKRALEATDPLWEAVLKREKDPLSRFFYAVKTTGIYCRPDCPARRPKRQNVSFYASCAQAEADGGLSGYRWGVERKSAILDVERKAG